ncbi:MAG: acetyl-CoA carboxylase biotin carboxylase subunit [Steroidobacteraceae bacterium]
MFDKILIANRGEIACRIARTARRLGIRTVAVYSEADRNALHVETCDEAVCIGPAEARRSYLDIGRILRASTATGAEAVHPGYGFLSENADFAAACADTGIRFIGPPVAAIRAMGSKAAAKSLMAQAGVPVTPGYHGADQDDAVLAENAARIGYPLLIKASAGGGGKGMRAVRAAAEFADALAACRREAKSSFGSDEVLIEKLIENPRHVEVQVFADQHGHCLHLFERDCSMQRRHQKVIEEAPAPGLHSSLRAALGAAAVKAAEAVGYVGAGTVEFLLGEGGEFYFMEMNTRLQVEHPVTEMITGLDLVEWQLRVAAGESLPLDQGGIRQDGHAIEARIYAEDPARGFLPASGQLAHVRWPERSATLRVDAGFREGDIVTPWYDSMLAKVVAHGADRDSARRALLQALERTQISGIANNVAFLRGLLGDERFIAARLSTTLIDADSAVARSTAAAVPGRILALAALACAALERDSRNAAHSSPWWSSGSWRLNADTVQSIGLRHGGEDIRANVIGAAPPMQVVLADKIFNLAWFNYQDRRLRAEIDGSMSVATVIMSAKECHLLTDDGDEWRIERIARLQHDSSLRQGDGDLRAPMPGRVIRINVAANQQVAKGASLMVIEAMKMEHTVAAPHAGRIQAIRAKVGDQVPEGAELVDLVPVADADGAAKN